MNGARDAMLLRTAAAAATGLLPEASAEHPVLAARRGLEDLPPGGLVRRFADSFRNLTGEVHEADDPAAAADVIAEVARKHGATTLLSWEPLSLPVPGLPELLRARGLELTVPDLPVEAGSRRAALDGLEPLAVGLTGAVAALADTGSLVVASGPGRPRLASLLPPVHIALVRRALIVGSLFDLLGDGGGLVSKVSNLVVITGPSRTADIEMTLTYGVHGPAEIHAILVP